MYICIHTPFFPKITVSQQSVSQKSALQNQKRTVKCWFEKMNCPAPNEKNIFKNISRKTLYLVAVVYPRQFFSSFPSKSPETFGSHGCWPSCSVVWKARFSVFFTNGKERGSQSHTAGGRGVFWEGKFPLKIKKVFLNHVLFPLIKRNFWYCVIDEIHRFITNTPTKKRTPNWAGKNMSQKKAQTHNAFVNLCIKKMNLNQASD